MTATVGTTRRGAGGAATTGAGRVGNVDVLRAIAASAVLMISAYALGGRVAPIKAQYWYDVPLDWLASGVWLFFGISGYVISRPFVERLLTQRPLPSIGAYAIRRVFRIFPLYWIALTAVIVIHGTDAAHKWQLIFHYALLNNLVPGRQGAILSVAWTLTLEVLFYIAVPVLALAVRYRWRVLSAERLTVLVVGSWVASILFTALVDLKTGKTGVWLRMSLPAMWQMFCPGILLAVAPHLRRDSFRRWIVELPARRSAAAVAVAALALAAVMSADAPVGFGAAPFQLIVDASRPLFAVGYGIAIAAAVRARPWGRPGGAVLWLGLVSYGIYLLHAVAGTFLEKHLSWVPVHGSGLGPFLVHIIFLFALTIPLAAASWHLLEQPAIKLGRTLARRWEQRYDRRIARQRASNDSLETMMRGFWNARAKEDPFYFVDSRQPYRNPRQDRFWDVSDPLERLFDDLGVRIRSEDRVLEIGCGVGRMTRVLAEHADEVLALDVSDEMIAQAREHNPHLSNVRWLIGDGTSLHGIDDASVDACTALVVFQHLPDPRIALGYVEEIARVLRPKGWAIVHISNDTEFHRPQPSLATLVGRGPKGWRHPAWVGSPVELDDLARTAEGAGLRIEAVQDEGTLFCCVLLRKPAV